MPIQREPLAATLRPVAYVLLGFVGTVVLALVALNVTTGLQGSIYHAVYPLLGPTAATQTAMVWQFALCALLASTLPALAVAHYHQGTAGVRSLAPGLLATGALIALFALLSGVRVAPFLLVLPVLGIALLTIPVLLHYRRGINSPALPTLGGAVPVVVLLFLLLGFGMGWGWGYVLVAETTDTAFTSNGDVADFDAVPTVRDDLFTENRCSGFADGGQQCILSIRGYAHERAAVRWLAKHGVRCPYVNAKPGTARDPGSFIAEHDGDYYRVTCGTHGD